VHWTNSAAPTAKRLGVDELVVSWDGGASPIMKAARGRGYRVYVEASPQQAAAVAEASAKLGLAGVILNVRQRERQGAQAALRKLRSTYPQLRFLLLNPDGKQPQMKGGLIIKRDAILEISSPTAQPWIDTNLALIRIEQVSDPEQIPLYTFSWNFSDPAQQERGPTAEDYLLAVAEAGAFHADLILDLPEELQKGLAQNNASAWAVWNQVKPFVEFYSTATKARRKPAANVGVVIDNFETSYEAVNLLARHNIPFRVLHPSDLKSVDLNGFEVIVVFAKPDKEAAARISEIAARGGTVVLVESAGSYPWQTAQPERMNEHTVSYVVGKGRVLELSEPVTDPETFAQDIRRQDRFHEEILVEDHVLALVGAQCSEDVAGLAEVRPAPRQRNGLHVGDGLDLPRVAERSVEPQDRSPVVHDEGDIAREVQGVEPRVEIPRMIRELVCRRRRFSRLAHPDEVRRETSPEPR